MERFSPETPLGRAIQQLLKETSDGQTVAELMRALRRRGQHVNEANLKRILAHRHVFALLPGDRYALIGTPVAAALPPPPPPVGSAEIRTATRWDWPLVANMPYAQTDYVVFDLETTGLDAEHDRIVQIAALSVRAGQIESMRNWYVNPAPATIPYSLQFKLGLIDHPQIAAAINAAPPLADVLPEFAAYIGDRPLVAHNARFDGRFLEAALGPALTNRFVDTLELAMLLFPGLPNHQLATVAEAGLGLSLEQLAEQWRAQAISSAFHAHEIGHDTLHNAITDVFVLHHVYLKLRDYLTTQTHPWLRAMLPELFERAALYTGVAPEIAERQRRQCRWPLRQSVGNTLSAAAMLTTHLAQRGYGIRTGQLEMQAIVESALADEAYAMIEAPTGTGKTLAYLTAAVRRAVHDQRPVALSTAYRNLQDQLLGEIDALHSSQVATFSSQLLKGVGNYVCWTALQRYLDEGDPARDGGQSLRLDERYILAFVGIWLPGSANGCLDELPYWVQQTLPTAGAILHQLRATGACAPSVQPSCDCCPLPAATENAKSADILVINHALWLSEASRLPPFARLVVDEAHTLEDVATEAFTEEVSSQQINDLLHRAFDARTERGILPRLMATTTNPAIRSAVSAAIGAVRRVGRACESFGPYLARFIRQCTARVDPRYGAAYRLEAPPWKIHGTRWQAVNQAHQQLFADHLPDLLTALQQVIATVRSDESVRYKQATLHDLTELWEGLAEQRQLAFAIPKVAETRLVYWAEVGPPRDAESAERDPAPQWWALKQAPIDVGAALQPFYDKQLSICFLSATLTVRGNDFSYFVDRLGLASRLAERQTRQLPPALPYDRQVLLGLTDYLTHVPMQHAMESFKEELARELELLLHFTGGRALGLFTARERMEFVAKQIERQLAEAGIPLHVQQPDGSRKRLLEEFIARPEAVLFGLRSFWEGVDAPGETLSFVLMEKLPFPLLIAPIHRARAERLMQLGRSEFDDYMLPLMLLQFKQGFGRLMRRESDQGAVILFDKRIHRKQYKYDLLASLPGFLPRDEAAERSRRAFYALLLAHFPALFGPAAAETVEALPADIILDYEALLAKHLLPDRVSDAAYAAVRPQLLRALKELFGFEAFRTIQGLAAQETVIQHILAGRDVIGVLPTGAGKSLTFQLTALVRDGVTLVFSPLIALMRDQVAGLRARGIEIVGAIYSGQSASERDDILDRMQHGKMRLVYISPERLRDPRLLIALANTRVIQMVVDEAHCVYMWGPSFRPDFLYLPRLFDVIGHRPPIAALTATATAHMRDAIAAALAMNNPAQVIAPINRPELNFIVYNGQTRFGAIRSKADRFRQLLRILQAADLERPPILIYVATVREVDQLARRLLVMGFDARAYHGQMHPPDRVSVQELFMDDHINIVVCTKAFGMGVDKPNIRYVIHYNMPSDLESYYQEAGRAGRDGKPAYCILLHHASDIDTQNYFIANGLPDEETINHVLNALRARPGETLYLDPRSFAEALGLEDTQLRVALHHLEAQQFIVRSADFTLTGSILLNQPAVSVSGAEGAILQQLAAAGQWRAQVQAELNLLALRAATGLAPETIDQTLFTLDHAGVLLYRPWQRGIVIEKAARLTSGQALQAGTLAAEQHRAVMGDKLQTMVRYAAEGGRCRRQQVLTYFGEDAPNRCAGCDHCLPADAWPWATVSSQDFATPDAFIDPAFVVLEAVQWNLERAKRYGSPYGTGMLITILKGDEYNAARFVLEPHLKRWRMQQMRACPQWGALAYWPARDRRIDALIQRLLDEGYVSSDRWTFDAHDYDYLKLKDKGWQQLESGTLLQWEVG